jgi:hypothetical protein
MIKDLFPKHTFEAMPYTYREYIGILEQENASFLYTHFHHLLYKMYHIQPRLVYNQLCELFSFTVSETEYQKFIAYMKKTDNINDYKVLLLFYNMYVNPLLERQKQLTEENKKIDNESIKNIEYQINSLRKNVKRNSTTPEQIKLQAQLRKSEMDLKLYNGPNSKYYANSVIIKDIMKLSYFTNYTGNEIRDIVSSYKQLFTEKINIFDVRSFALIDQFSLENNYVCS